MKNCSFQFHIKIPTNTCPSHDVCKEEPPLDTHVLRLNRKHRTSTMWKITKQLTHGMRYILPIPSTQSTFSNFLTLCEHIITPTLKSQKCTCSVKTTPYFHPRYRSCPKVDVRKCTGRENNTNKTQANRRLDKLASKNRWPSTHPCLAVPTTAFSPPSTTFLCYWTGQFKFN